MAVTRMSLVLLRLLCRVRGFCRKIRLRILIGRVRLKRILLRCTWNITLCGRTMRLSKVTSLSRLVSTCLWWLTLTRLSLTSRAPQRMLRLPVSRVLMSRSRRRNRMAILKLILLLVLTVSLTVRCILIICGLRIIISLRLLRTRLRILTLLPLRLRLCLFRRTSGILMVLTTVRVRLVRRVTTSM